MHKTEYKLTNISQLKRMCFHLIAFSLPLLPKILPVLIFATLLFWILEKDFNKKWERLKTNRFHFLLPVFYLLYVAGLAWSENLGYAFSDLEIKVSLLLLPLIILSAPIDQNLFNKILSRFIEGCLFTLALLFINAFYLHYILGEAKYFYYSDFSVHLHPSYLALYINFAMVVLLYKLMMVRQGVIKKAALAAAIFFLFSGVILLLSKTGILSLIISMGLGVVFFSVKKKKIVSTVLIASAVIVAGAFWLSPQLNERFNELKSGIDHKENGKEAFSSTSLRKFVWISGAEIISENPFFGVGTGDVKDQLLKKYEKFGMNKALDNKLNAHNQYIQTAIALGFPGLVWLIVILFVTLFYSIKIKNWIFFILILLLLFNFATESMLERQSGVIFFSFFTSLFMVRMNRSSPLFIDRSSKDF